MGADIHTMVIVNKPHYVRTENEKGVVEFKKDGYKWELLNAWSKNDRYNPESEDKWERTEYFPLPCFSDRNYPLFGILAGVRSNEYPQIDAVRGLPLGCPQEVKDYLDVWGNYVFGVTWYSLGEIERAVRDKKRYPKHDTWEDEDGVIHKDKESYGPHYSLKRLRDSIRNMVDACTWVDDPEDIRVVMFFDN